MPYFFSPVLTLVQWLLIFVCLTIYGAMWNGAQQNNQKGWFVAALSATITLVVLKASHGIYQAVSDLQTCA
jgi:uncharacterized membrane protein YiaA